MKTAEMEEMEEMELGQIAMELGQILIAATRHFCRDIGISESDPNTYIIARFTLEALLESLPEPTSTSPTTSPTTTTPEAEE